MPTGELRLPKLSGLELKRNVCKCEVDAVDHGKLRPHALPWGSLVSFFEKCGFAFKIGEHCNGQDDSIVQLRTVQLVGSSYDRELNSYVLYICGRLGKSSIEKVCTNKRTDCSAHCSQNCADREETSVPGFEKEKEKRERGKKTLL